MIKRPCLDRYHVQSQHGRNTYRRRKSDAWDPGGDGARRRVLDHVTALCGLRWQERLSVTPGVCTWVVREHRGILAKRHWEEIGLLMSADITR